MNNITYIDLLNNNLKGEDFLNYCREVKKKNRFQKTFTMFSTPVPKLPSGWIWTCISEVSERVSVGHVGPTSIFFTESADGVPLVRSQDVRPGKLCVDNSLLITRAFHEKLKKSQLKSGDILIVRVGANRADACEVPKGVSELNCANIVFARPISRNGYITHYFRSAFGREMLLSVTTGSAQGVLNTQTVARLPVPLPPLKVQYKIAAILSAYDDLIENNKRRITLLEKMAEEIYREWFVRFRFPGYQTAEFEKGIPKGWELKTFRELVSYYIGGGWGEESESPTFTEGAFVIRGTDIPALSNGDYSNRVFRYHKPSNLKSRKLERNDFIFEVSGGSKDQLLGRNIMVTEGILSLFDHKVMCASFCKQMRFDPEIVSPFFMKYYMKLYYDCDLVGIYQVQSTGISNYQFESFLNYQTIAIPVSNIMKKFEAMVEPLIQQQETLAFKNINLKRIKDSLLPRLISGKLSVEDLDIQFPPSMQEDSAA